MSCLKAFEIDLPGFLAQPREDEFATFRDHYPRCPECSAEVRAWTELDDQLRRSAGSEPIGGAPASRHPSASLLAGYGDDPSGVGASERRDLERHLTACPSCRDELRALERFSPERLVTGAGAAATPKPRRQRLRPWLVSLGRLAWHPAVAYAVLILILLPTWLPTFSDRVRPAPAVAPSPLPLPSPSLLQRGLLSRADRNRPLAVSEQEAFSARESASSLRQIPVPTVAATDALARRREPAPIQERASGKKEAKAFGEKAFADAESFGVRGLAAKSRALVGARVPATRKPSAESPAPTVRLQSDRIVDVSAPSIRGEIRLRIPLPGGWGGEREVRIRVSDPTGRRELRERRAPEPGATEVEIGVPAAWLTPGLYRVELAAPRSGSAAAFAFRVP